MSNSIKIVALLFCIGLVLLFFQKYEVGVSKRGLIPESSKSLDKPADNNYLLFSCRNGCPTFIASVDFEGKGGSSTVVKLKTAMTRGAGKIIIFDDFDGRLLYDSGELPQIAVQVKDSPSNDDFMQTLEVTYTTDIYTYSPAKFTVYFDENENKLKERE